MKLQLQVNSRAIKDATRALVPAGILLTPAIDESFWLYRVPVSDGQAIVGFPKFGVIGIGFQNEQDWNTNLPSGGAAEKIYDHIKHNKQDTAIPRQRCLDAIRLIQAATIEGSRQTAIAALKAATNEADKLRALSVFLRHTSNWQVAEAFDRDL